MLAKWQLLLFVVDIFPHTFMGICKLHRGTGYSHLSRVKTLYPAAAPAQYSPIHNVSFTEDFSKVWVFLLSFEKSFKFSWNLFPIFQLFLPRKEHLSPVIPLLTEKETCYLLKKNKVHLQCALCCLYLLAWNVPWQFETGTKCHHRKSTWINIYMHQLSSAKTHSVQSQKGCGV